MTSFDDREHAFEAQFARQTELEFKIAARRDRLLGRWAAAQMKLPEPEAEVYAASLVREDLKHAGDEDVVAKLIADLAPHGVSEALVHEALAEAQADARREVEAGL